MPGTSTGSGVQSERASSRAELAVRGLCKDSAPSAGQPEGRPLRRKSPVGAEEKKAAKKDALFFRECTCKMEVDTHKSVGVCFFMVR